MKLTPTMNALIVYMRKHGGSIHRHPGGFWAHETWQFRDSEWFGTSSVAAIVSRGAATYSEMKESKKGPAFPVKATLVTPS